jgi:NAD/NADP transhydrogenase beta subunit
VDLHTQSLGRSVTIAGASDPQNALKRQVLVLAGVGIGAVTITGLVVGFGVGAGVLSTHSHFAGGQRSTQT